MPSERIQRQIDRLLDEADDAARRLDWDTVASRARAALGFDPQSSDARDYLHIAERNSGTEAATADTGSAAAPSGPSERAPTPTSFVEGRYQVKKFLGEGGKKRVYLAHDTRLDRDVAFALIKTEGLDEVGRERIRREAQAMGRLGSHPHVVSVFDLGETDGQPYLVAELMGGGDVEGTIENAPEHRVPLPEAIRIADEVCRGLEFAHSNRIVHRDLKPGNVWLTTDGAAKIGDFGLAVATDRARLTQPGLMVGTVSYMPPEQAMGGEVTQRSDLYSLGAMLYELATGRPPFIGDESVAIISQHLNAPPVAPSWYTPDLPPGLETLILRLLEKDASKRPASAAEVRQLLSAVRAPAAPQQPEEGTTPQSRTTGHSPSGSNPLYRRVFVGREHELEQLKDAFDAAVSGRGSLVTVVGEPGIGKTALCEQLATYAAMRGSRALVGHSYEEGSQTLPYLPFVEALRSHVLAREPDVLRTELGSGAAEVARILSEIRDRVRVEPPPPGDPEDDRWRLFQAVTGFLKNASTVQPILLVLEDLHWADRGTLDYLVHLARNLEGVRLLVVGTYRDIEVDRTHPLSAALAELRRTADMPRVFLRGLTPDEVHRMIVTLTGQEVPWSLAEAVHRQTEGNPLFVQEVLRYLVEEGYITGGAGRSERIGDIPPELHIPEGLRDVIGKRLSRLGAECSRLLTMAAVMGREFHLQTLQQVAGMEEEALLVALEEALRAAVLEEHSAVGTVRYRFTHAFFQQTLYAEIIAPRRIRLHQQVGRALEAVYARRLDEHAAELAEHFSHSSDAGDLTKAVQYGERATQRAMAVFAYGEAVRHMERCLQVQEVLDPDDRLKRCDLLLALAEALRPAGESLRAAREVAPKAFALAEAIGDRRRTCRASLLALDALHSHGRLQIARSPEYQEWVARADASAADGTAERVRVDVHLSMMHQAAGRQDEGSMVCWRALDLARRLGDYESMYASASRLLILFLHGVASSGERLQLAEELVQWPWEASSTRQVLTGLSIAGHVLLANGDRGGAERCWRQLAEIADRTQDTNALLQVLELAIVTATLDGDFERAMGGLERLSTRAAELGIAGSAQNHLYATRLCAYLAREDLADLVTSRSAGGQANTALCLAFLGRETEARQVVAEGLPDLTSTEGTRIDRLTLWLEASVLLRDSELAARILSRLESASHLLIGTYSDHTCVARHLGAAAALIGDHDGARRFTDQAIAVATRVSHRPEMALSRLQLAEVLLSGSDEDRAQAAVHLDQAIDELRAMKMQPALERALRHKGLLHA